MPVGVMWMRRCLGWAACRETPRQEKGTTVPFGGGGDARRACRAVSRERRV